MAIRITTRITVAAIACNIFFYLLTPISRGQAVSPPSEIKVTALDQNGAVIGDCDVVFKSDLRRVVSHTSKDGSVILSLPSGRYTVTTSHLGFLKNEVPDFQVIAPELSELRVVLKVDPHSEICGPGCGCSSCLSIPTTTSDLPSVIASEPSREPSAQPVTTKIRSWRCLYLWKCSAS